MKNCGGKLSLVLGRQGLYWCKGAIRIEEKGAGLREACRNALCLSRCEA